MFKSFRIVLRALLSKRESEVIVCLSKVRIIMDRLFEFNLRRSELLGAPGYCAAQERPAPIETIGTSTDPMEESSELATSTSPLDGRRSLTLSSSHGRTDKIQEGA
jgi:hypothetical protein